MASELQEHAKYSPSSLELLESCPCYEQDPTRDDSAAKDGTRLHKATELADLALCEDADEEDAVKRCLEMKDQIQKGFGSDCKVYLEFELLVGELTKGTGDVVMVRKNKAALIDWKFGRNPVADAEDNPQMQGYALGVFTMFPGVDEVEVHIVGPRMDFYSTATYRRSDVDRIRDRIQTIISRCEDPEKVESASEKSCRFCGRKAICPQVTGTAIAVASRLGLPMPIELKPGRIIRLEDRAKAQVLSYILEDWAKQVREYNLKAALEDGIEIPGFVVRSRKGNTTVTDVFNAVKTVLDTYELISLDEILQACSLSVAKLVEQLYAKTQVAGMKEAKSAIRAKVDNTLKDYVTTAGTITFLQRQKGKKNEEIIKAISN